MPRKIRSVGCLFPRIKHSRCERVPTMSATVEGPADNRFRAAARRRSHRHGRRRRTKGWSRNARAQWRRARGAPHELRTGPAHPKSELESAAQSCRLRLDYAMQAWLRVTLSEGLRMLLWG
jgi:hypothetical protein